jgi:hypothetical protein
MNRLRTYVTSSLVLFAASILPVVALTGCAIGTASFPDSSPVPEHAPIGSISGSNFGGHAPLIGAHVYVLQPSTSGYGTRASSILSSTGANNGATNPTPVLNSSDPDIPNTWYYQTTDLTGAFNISGDYTCTVGLPVYLYLYGGSPTYPSANNTFQISSFIVSGSSGAYTVTMTINTSGSQPIENAYIGEGLTVASTNGASPTGSQPFNGSFQIVTAPNLTTTTFSFTYASATLPSGVTTGTTYTESGNQMTVTFDPTFNPGVVNLASLGNCPSGGFTGANAISYVYVNEVSTVAAAYAFRPFQLTPTSTSTGNNATYIGTSSTNIAGIQNAAVIAKQLYDITGSKLSTTYAGEGHIANTNTVAGNGIVPQANIDTLGNILAACVDSNNGATSVTSGGGYNYPGNGAYTGISPQCQTLFQTATSSGIPTTSTGTGANAPGYQPLDIAQAAINIARHPAGPTYSYSTTGSTTFVSTLYNLPQGNRPFTPDLSSLGVTASQLNDFTIGILYTVANNPANSSNGGNGGSYMNSVETIAIDKIGNVWAVADNGGSPNYLYRMSPAGVIGNVNYQSSWQYGTVVIDANESAWSASAVDRQAVTYVQNTNSSTVAPAVGAAPVTYTYNAGATNATKNTYYSYSAVADSFGDVYFGNAGLTAVYNASSSPNDYVAVFSGGSPTSTGVESGAITGINNYNAISFLNGSIQPYASGTGKTSAFFEYNAYSSGQVEIDSVQLSSSTGTVLTSGGIPVNDTGFPVYGINTNGSPGTNAFAQTPTTGCTSLLNAGKLTTDRGGNAVVPDFHNQTGAINDATSSLYYIIRGTGTSGTCTQVSGATLNAGIKDGWASTLDGNDYVYIANRPASNSSLSVVNSQANTAAGMVAVSPATGYFPQYWNGSALTNMLPNPFDVAVGPSGEVWVPNNSTTLGLVEIVGLGNPTATPFAVASSPTNNLIGIRP